MRYLVNNIGINYTDSIVNIVAYVVAPVLSFVALWGLLLIIDRLKDCKYTKFMFGIKLTL